MMIRGVRVNQWLKQKSVQNLVRQVFQERVFVCEIDIGVGLANAGTNYGGWATPLVRTCANWLMRSKPRCRRKPRE